jgi:hypothetical protein
VAGLMGSMKISIVADRFEGEHTASGFPRRIEIILRECKRVGRDLGLVSRLRGRYRPSTSPGLGHWRCRRLG